MQQWPMQQRFLSQPCASPSPYPTGLEQLAGMAPPLFQPQPLLCAPPLFAKQPQFDYAFRWEGSEV